MGQLDAIIGDEDGEQARRRRRAGVLTEIVSSVICLFANLLCDELRKRPAEQTAPSGVPLVN